MGGYAGLARILSEVPMTAKRHRISALLGTILAIGSAGACRSRTPNRGHSATQTQAALGSAVRQIAETMEPGRTAVTIDPPPSAAAAEIPEVALRGGGPMAEASVRTDENHVGATVARTESGFAVTWGDQERSRVFFAQLDATGRALAASRLLRQAIPDEEDAVGASLAVGDRELGVAWADTANGRVRFARVRPNGDAIGTPTLLHDGLEMPRSTAVAWDGREWGVAVQMDRGVYFARVGHDGARIGDGVLLTEGAAVGAIASVRASADGFEVVWRDPNRGAEHRAVIGRDGRVHDGDAQRADTRLRLAAR